MSNGTLFDKVFGGITGGVFSGDKDKTPSVTAQSTTPKKTAARLDQGTEIARKNRIKRASAVTGEKVIPTLGQPGLLGLPGLRQ